MAFLNTKICRNTSPIYISNEHSLMVLVFAVVVWSIILVKTGYFTFCRILEMISDGYDDLPNFVIGFPLRIFQTNFRRFCEWQFTPKSNKNLLSCPNSIYPQEDKYSISRTPKCANILLSYTTSCMVLLSSGCVHSYSPSKVSMVDEKMDSINIWTTATQLVPLSSVYQVPSNEAILRLLALYSTKLA